MGTQALSIRITPKAAVEIKECLAGTADWFEAYRLDVTPMPIEVAAGKDITLDGEITLKQMVEVGATLALKLTGEVPVIGKIPIPCLEINPDLHIGSCTYDAGGDAVTLTLPEIPDILLPILSPLKAIDVEITGMKPDGTPVACLASSVEITVG